LKALPASRGKQLPDLKPTGDFEVIEACYIRDVSGKQGAFYRSALDRNIKERDCQIAAMGYHRQAATRISAETRPRAGERLATDRMESTR
jgi:hypothetical protein